MDWMENKNENKKGTNKTIDWISQNKGQTNKLFVYVEGEVFVFNFGALLILLN